MSGWTLYDSTSNSEWGSWSDWDYNPSLTASSTRQVETRYRHDIRLNYYDSNGNLLSQELVERTYSSTRPEWSAPEGRYYNSDGTYYEYGESIHEQHRYRDLVTTYTYYYYCWGNWSSWSNSSVTQTNDREVQTRTVFRYKDLVTKTIYYFWRWSDWSDWLLTEEIASDDKEIETRVVYRSREGEKVPIYYYYDWSEWSEWSFDAVTEKENCEIETQTVYRYSDRE